MWENDPPGRRYLSLLKMENDERNIREKMRDRVSEHYSNASRTVAEKEEQVTDSIRERQLTWVASAFVVGVAVGVLYKKRW